MLFLFLYVTIIYEMHLVSLNYLICSFRLTFLHIDKVVSKGKEIYAKIEYSRDYRVIIHLKSYPIKYYVFKNIL